MQATLERLRRRREEEGDEGGFTLIELLIVIVILGILAAIVVFAVQNLTSTSSQASCGSDYKTVETAVEAFRAQIGVDPGDTIPGPWAPTTTITAPAPYSAAAPGSNGDAATMNELLNTYGNGTTTVGPWLKDAPFNPGHYTISVAPPTTLGVGGNATVTVLVAGAPVASCANAT